MTDVRLRPVGDVELCVETFGDPTEPAILLIMGLAAPMDWWPDGFCERLASEGQRYVVRYDHRDTGQSTSFEPGAPSYTAADLTTDAVGLLDALGLDRVHLVGASAGGGIAQEIATNHPARVASLTLVSTTFAGPGGPDDLPGMSDELDRAFAEPAAPPVWSDREAVIDYLADDARPYHGSVTMDDDQWRTLFGRIFDRTKNMASAVTNHWIVIEDGTAAGPRIDRIKAPTLVLHGTEDPLFPFAHGEALAAAIPAARLVALDGVGHAELPPEVWDVAVPAIVQHTTPSP